MILSERLSPSALTTMEMCEMKWFIGYVLNYREPSGEAAVLGTAAHDVMEGITLSKLCRQTGTPQKHRAFGEVGESYDLDELCDLAYEYHKKDNPLLKWAKKQRTVVFDYVYKTKEHKFFPENHHEIVSPEQYFREEIGEDWAEFTEIEDGKLKKGRLKIAGKIDLVYRDKTGQLHYLDYKFGKRGPWDWAKDKEKTFETMKTDIQLCLYYWAAKRLYPNETPITHIWYVNADTVWTDAFSQKEEDYAMETVERVFARIKSMDKPSTRYGKHCAFCAFKKNNLGNWGRPELDLVAIGSEKFKPIDDKKSCCDTIKYFSEYRSLPVIVENCKDG